MDTLAQELIRLLRAWGPPLLTLLAFLETSFITGLVVPAGVALLVASFLAVQGLMNLPAAVGAACLGAWLGDSTGFWVGRHAGRWVVDHDGPGARVLAGRRVRLRRLLQAPPFVSVTLARVVAFVRTLMPLGAGMGTIGYARFLVWDALGILLWAASYVVVGTLAGEGWERASRWVGAGWLAVFAVAVVAVFLGRRRGRAGEDRLVSVALTGNAASGKSTVAEVWREAGVPVVDADALARAAVEPGSPALAAIREAFGTGVLADDGTLDRAALRTRILDEPEARARLEGILHPRIAALRAAWVEEQRALGATLVVSEIPLLFETGLDADFEVVVVVHVPAETAHRRLVERGLPEADATRLLEAQIPSGETRHLADHVIVNTGTTDDLRREAERVLGLLRRPTRAGRAAP